jgi:hypothetical protein
MGTGTTRCECSVRSTFPSLFCLSPFSGAGGNRGFVLSLARDVFLRSGPCRSHLRRRTLTSSWSTTFAIESGWGIAWIVLRCRDAWIRSSPTAARCDSSFLTISNGDIHARGFRGHANPEQSNPFEIIHRITSLISFVMSA